MKRLGKYTGNVYDSAKGVQECCTCITEEQAQDEKWVKTQHAKDLARCIMCMGCPEANKNK